MSNPIISKEVISSLRTWKAALMQAMFLLVAAGLAWVLWPAGGLQDMGGKQAERLLSVLAIGELVMIALFAPAFTAASLTLERERNTLESLFATALRPWEIATGKMLGSLAFLLLLVLCGTPALAATFMLGGVPGTQVLAVLALLLLTAVYLGMIGLLVSSVMHRSYRSIIVTYAILLVVCFLTALPAWPISRNLITYAGPASRVALHVLASFSPLEAMMSLVWPNSTYTTGAAGMPPFWQVYIIVSCVVIAASAAVLLAKLHRPIAPPRPRERLKIVERGKVTARTFLFLIDPRKRKRMIRWWQNPVLIKEFRTRPMLQAHWLLRSVAVCLIISILLMLLVILSVMRFVGESGGFFQMLASAVATLMVVMIVLIGPAMSSGTICSDRESGVWDLLRTTRLSSMRIVSGKFQASIIPMVLLVVAMTPPLVLLLYFDLGLWITVLRVLAVVGVTILFVCITGMFFSSVFARTSTATAWTYAVVVTLGLLTLLVMLGQSYGLFSGRFAESVYMLNPIAAVLDAAGNTNIQRYAPMIPYMRITGAAAAVMFLITVVRVFELRQHD